jgi:RNA polymerase sigma-70 factor (ECF subfamily)
MQLAMGIVTTQTGPEGAQGPAGTDWEQAIRQHGRRVLVSLLALGVRYDRAEELAQATWARLIEAEREGRLERVTLPGLALAQARFLAQNQQRSDAVVQRHVAPVDGPVALDPEQRLLGKEQLERALAVVTASSESAQRLFRLLYRDPSLSHADAADKLGLSVQRVRQILCELRKRVRGAMQGERP